MKVSATTQVASPLATTQRQPASTNGFDLTGDATLLLALLTGCLAIASFRQNSLSRKAIEATKLEAQQAFAAESLRQTEALTPIVVAEATAANPTQFRFLALKNVGQGPAVNVRFSGLLNGNEFSAAQYGVAALAASGCTSTPLQLHKDFESRWPVYELLIRYEDIFGNTYATEYIRFDEGAEWYTWKRPWLGKDLGLPKPGRCSDDEPPWGFKGRVYYDAPKALF